MFNESTHPYPQTWSEMSTDFKLMFGFLLCIMVLFVLGATVGLLSQLLIAGSLLAVAIAISAIRKLAAGWRWPGIGFKDIAGALLTVLLTVLFMFAVSPLSPPTSPQVLPFYLGIAGFGIFGTATDLRLVTYSEAEFRAQCGASPPIADSEPIEASRRSILRHVYSVAFLAVWIVGLGFFYFSGVGLRDGSPARTLTLTEPLTNHGHTVYVSAADKALIDALQTVAMIGIPSILLIGAILHFVLKIPVFRTRGRKDQ